MIRFSKIISICLIFVMLFISGCSSKNKTSLNYECIPNSMESGVIAENDCFQMIYNYDKACITLFDKSTGASFSSTPSDLAKQELDEYGMPKKNPPKLESPIIIEYINPETSVLSSVTAYTESISKKNFSSKLIENGIEITYFFESAKIAIPVKYVLTDEGFSVSIDPNKIQEEENLIYQISIAPFLCSLKNTSSGYMFVPSGSGALIKPQNLDSATGKSYITEVYGKDPQISNKYQTEFTLENECRLPVFGVAEDDLAIFAVINDGAESSLITAQTGVKNLGYSSVYAIWRLRSYQNIIHRLGMSMPTEKQLYSSEKVEETFNISYYPLYEDNANYSGMARKYRELLFGENKKNVSDDPFSLKIIGGVEIEKDFLGVPYKTLLPTTDFEQAYKIIDELYSQLNISFDANLIGYGESGCTTGKVAGGYKFSSKYGKLNELKNLNDLLNNIGGTLYMDFDVIKHSSKKIGSKAYDASENPIKLTEFSIWSGMKDETALSYYYNKRKDIKKITDKVIENAVSWGISGISLFDLSNTAYSDYSDNYYVKSKSAADYLKIYKTVSDNGLNIAASNANAYAAINSNIIYDTPIYSDFNDLFCAEIPFYQMVFKGYVSCMTPDINTSSDEREAILKAAQSGIGLSYIVYDEFEKDLIQLAETDFYGSEYSSIKEKMLSQIKEYMKYFNEVDNTSISEHSILENDIHKTVFENGVTVYVNFSDKPCASPIGEVQAMGYKFSYN